MAFSFSPTRNEQMEEAPQRPNGILRNRTNNHQNAENQQPEPAPSNPPIRTVNDLQNYAVNQSLKNLRPRNPSVGSQKSIGAGATTDDEKQAAVGRTHPRQTVVAFGRTTLAEDTIVGTRHPAPTTNRPPVGSIKDMMDLRKITETQSAQIVAQTEEIKKLKEMVQDQQRKYCYILESNAKLWSHLNALESASSSKEAIRNSKEMKCLMDKPMTKENEIPLSFIEAPQPKDSVAVKKYQERKQIEQPERKNPEEEQRQIVAASKKLELSTPDIKRLIQEKPEYADKLARILKEQAGGSEANEKETHRSHHHHQSRHHHQNHHSSIIEKITVERRKVVQNYSPPRRNNEDIQDYLSSTIDESLARLGYNERRQQQNYHGHHHRQQQQNYNARQHHHQRQPELPPTPRICEVTSSSDSSSPENHRRKERKGKGNQSDSDWDNARNDIHPSTIGCTNMPDQFNDDDVDFESDTETPVRHRGRRQSVGDRLRNNRRR